mmetsp:Transcript_856/g.1241  ORF Transcript_856/g.1241 Transcript_856/m.1241 type:complete len:186 (+) Transcript_856:52-609(+)
MELPEQDFSDMNNVDIKLFTKLIQVVCKSLLASSSRVPEQHLNDLESELATYDLKKMSGQLFSFISEVCRGDATTQTITTTLDDYQLDKEHRDKVASGIAHYKAKIREKFAETSVPISQLIGIEWRLCQDIKQQQMSRINTPSYLIELKFNNGTKRFECGYEQLQDLVARLKVARNSAIRLLSSE